MAYQPGLDAQGRPVVPADLPGSGAEALPLPETLSIPVTLALAPYLNLDPAGRSAQALEDTRIPLGTLTLSEGEILWNGVKLTDAQEDNLAVLCLSP